MSNCPKRKKDGPSFNNSFLTLPNTQWFHFIFQNWLPDVDKPLVFLPCGGGFKTRKKKSKDTRKFISNAMGHQVMSIVTRNSDYERVILSEPLTVIPYSLEAHNIRPDYNLPAEDLSIQSEWIFIERVGMILMKIKAEQSNRDFVYYCGCRHHFFILWFANKLVGNPFIIIYALEDIIHYSRAAETLHKYIQMIEHKGEEPYLELPPFEKFLKSRGRYTNRAFWESINIVQKKIEKYRITITTPEEHKKGFEQIYNFEYEPNFQKQLELFSKK